MKTKLLKPTPESIDLAVQLLRQGEIVAVPTETVYGLAGDSTNSNSIKKIFKAKENSTLIDGQLDNVLPIKNLTGGAQ